MTARRPATPRTPRAPAGRPDAARPRSTRESSGREETAKSTEASSARSIGIVINTRGAKSISLSWRFLVGVLVATMAFVLVTPTLNLYFQQMEQVRTLNEQIEAAKERNAALEREIAMWDDPDFVRSQARERLGFVLPGEQPWVVVDPEAIIGEEAQETYQQQMGYVTPIGPWYMEMWTSIETAGSTELETRGRQLVGVESTVPEEG